MFGAFHGNNHGSLNEPEPLSRISRRLLQATDPGLPEFYASFDSLYPELDPGNATTFDSWGMAVGSTPGSRRITDPALVHIGTGAFDISGNQEDEHFNINAESGWMNDYTSFSIAFWFKMGSSEADSNSALMATTGIHTSDYHGLKVWMRRNSYNNEYQYRPYMEWGAGTTNAAKISVNPLGLASGSGIVDTEWKERWTHIVATGGPTCGDFKLYINGTAYAYFNYNDCGAVSDASNFQFETDLTKPWNLTLGHDINSIEFDEAIDDVSVYNRILSQDEVTYEYQRTTTRQTVFSPPPPPPSPIATVLTEVLQVDEQENAVVTESVLNATRAGITNDAHLVYEVLTTPQDGTLQKDGVTLNMGDTFTQEDVSSNLIQYIHNVDLADTETGAALQDMFSLRLNDTDYEQTVILNIQVRKGASPLSNPTPVCV